MSIVRNMQHVNGNLVYMGYTIRLITGMWEDQPYTEWEASSTSDFTVIEDDLEKLLETIDFRVGE